MMDVVQAQKELMDTGLYEGVICYARNKKEGQFSFSCSYAGLVCFMAQCVGLVAKHTTLEQKDIIKIIDLLSKSSLRYIDGNETPAKAKRTEAKVREICGDMVQDATFTKGKWIFQYEKEGRGDV